MTQNELYQGITLVKVPHDVLDELYNNSKVPLYELDATKLYQNEYVIVQNGTETGSALTRVVGDELRLIDQNSVNAMTAIKARNKEQVFALDALMDDNVKVVTLTGVAGSGKTLCAIAAAIRKFEKNKYKKIILTRPSSQVGKRDLGLLPGTVEEKLMPFLLNFVCNFEVLFPHTLQKTASRCNVEDLFARYNIEIVPIQLLRGASFSNTLVIADEIQILDYHEMLTLGTRISEGSKLILMGDLNQRDERIAIDKTGLFKFINDQRVRNSKITATIHLSKCERGEVSELFSSVFDSNEQSI